MKNASLSKLFEQMADIMEIRGEDRFRINTYRKVGSIINDLPTDVETLYKTGKLQKIPGIGKSSLAKIEEFIKTGRITPHQQLLSEIPAQLLELLEIPGMGPKGVKAVYEKLNVTSIKELKKAIENGEVAELAGFGKKKAEVIAKGIDFRESSTGRIRLDQALEAVQIVGNFLEGLAGVEKIQPAGSVRRRAETIGDVDILVTAEKGKEIIKSFTQADFVQDIIGAGSTKGSAIVETETAPVHVDVRVVPKKSFGAASQYFTGSKQHNVRLREIAVKKKLKLNEYGLFKGRKMIAGSNEKEIYSQLGLDYIKPLLREDRGEVEAAQKHSLPHLITTGDIKGDMHVHTDASDGNCSIEEMVNAAEKAGYDYICITDHSKSSAIANGLSTKRLSAQIKEIQKLNEKIKGITVFSGTEVDILANGSLDFDDKLLSELDYVVASIHSGLGSSREKVTARTLKAMDNPYVHCIGHPTGRMIGQREPMDIDIDKVIKHAAGTNTALELNAQPQRLDLKDVHCRMAIESGVKLLIGTDAHSPQGLNLMAFGVTTAGRGWTGKNDVVNTFSVKKLKSWLKNKRGK